MLTGIVFLTNMPMIPPDISKEFTDQLYAITTPLCDEQGQSVELGDKGFLGLLALGYRGVVALRQRRNETHLFEKYSKNKKATPQRRKKRKSPVKKRPL